MRRGCVCPLFLSLSSPYLSFLAPFVPAPFFLAPLWLFHVQDAPSLVSHAPVVLSLGRLASTLSPLALAPARTRLVFTLETMGLVPLVGILIALTTMMPITRLMAAACTLAAPVHCLLCTLTALSSDTCLHVTASQHTTG